MRLYQRASLPALPLPPSRGSRDYFSVSRFICSKCGTAIFSRAKSDDEVYLFIGVICIFAIPAARKKKKKHTLDERARARMMFAKRSAFMFIRHRTLVFIAIVETIISVTLAEIVRSQLPQRRNRKSIRNP